MILCNKEELEKKLERLILEHKTIDQLIAHLICTHYTDQLYIQRLKKRKLYLKDSIRSIKDHLIPNIIA